MHFEKDMRREYESNENSFKQLIVKIVSQCKSIPRCPKTLTFRSWSYCSLKLFQRYLFIGFVASFSIFCLIVRFVDKVLWLQKVIIKVTERLMAPFMIDLIDLRADRSQPSWLSWSILDLSVLALLISSVVAICKIGRGQNFENFESFVQVHQ